MDSLPLRLYYPSGNVVDVIGKFLGLHSPPSGLLIEVEKDVQVGDQFVEAGAALVGDPRCVCINAETHEVLYNPREHILRLESNWKEWLEENPAWPHQLELQTPTRKYSPPPWVWTDAGGREAYSLRAESGMPIVAPVMMIAAGRDQKQRTKEFNRVKKQSHAKMAVVAPNPMDAALLMNAAKLFEVCQALYDATEPDADASKLADARVSVAAVIKLAKTPFTTLPPAPR